MNWEKYQLWELMDNSTQHTINHLILAIRNLGTIQPPKALASGRAKW